MDPGERLYRLAQTQSIVALIATAVLVTFLWLEEINEALGTWHMTIDLAKTFFSISTRKEDQE